jgi:nitrogen regulatory protein PII
MYQLVILVLADAQKLDAALEAWQAAGASGITILESTGMGKVHDLLHRDDLPLFPSLRDLLQQEQVSHCTLFTVAEGEELVEQLVAAAQQVVGDFDADDAGILFTLPVGRAYGIRRRRE